MSRRACSYLDLCTERVLGGERKKALRGAYGGDVKMSALWRARPVNLGHRGCACKRGQKREKGDRHYAALCPNDPPWHTGRRRGPAEQPSLPRTGRLSAGRPQQLGWRQRLCRLCSDTSRLRPLHRAMNCNLSFFECTYHRHCWDLSGARGWGGLRAIGGTGPHHVQLCVAPTADGWQLQ